MEEGNAQNKRDMEAALKFRSQLQTLQAQCRTAEDRFCRQFGMDTQVATLRQTRDQDLREIVRKLGEENNALRADNQYFREQVEILICEQMEILMMQEVARSNSELKQDSLEKYIAKHLVNGRHIADLEAEVKGQESEVKLQRRLSAENEQKNAFIKEVVAELSAINERDILSLHIKDQKLQIKALVSQVHRSEERSCELAATNKQLSKSYQNKLEILLRNHKEIMTDVQEQLEKLRSQAEQFEANVKELEKVIDEKDSHMVTISKALRSEEEQVHCERKQRQSLQEKVSDLEKSTHKMDAIRQVIDPSAAANQEITRDMVHRFAFELAPRESSLQKAGEYFPLAGEEGQGPLASLQDSNIEEVSFMPVLKKERGTVQRNRMGTEQGAGNLELGEGRDGKEGVGDDSVLSVRSSASTPVKITSRNSTTGSTASSWTKYNTKVGIGLYFQRSQYGLEVKSIGKGSAADVCGRVAIGDVIVAVNGEPVQGASLAELASKVLGEYNSIIECSFLRNSQNSPDFFTISLTRGAASN